MATKKTKKVIGKLNKKALKSIGDMDVVFVIDCTGSMGPYIDEARTYMVDIAKDIEKKNKLNLKFAVVAYRDHPPQDMTFVTNVFDFVNIDGLQGILNQLSASGGGDRAEAVWDGVKAACELSWRKNSDRIVYLVGDSPPHGHEGANSGDSFPRGCPCNITDQDLVKLLNTKKIELNAHSIAAHEDTTKAFKLLADPTKGTVTIGNRPAQMTTSYSSTFSSHGSLSYTGSLVVNTMATTGKGYGAAAASVGLSATETSALADYLDRRDILKKEDDTTTTTNDSTTTVKHD